MLFFCKWATCAREKNGNLRYYSTWCVRKRHQIKCQCLQLKECDHSDIYYIITNCVIFIGYYIHISVISVFRAKKRKTEYWWDAWAFLIHDLKRRESNILESWKLKHSQKSWLLSWTNQEIAIPKCKSDVDNNYLNV